MKLFGKGAFTAGIAVGLAMSISTALGQAPPSPKPFVIFDGTLYSGKPDLSAYGVQPITSVYVGQFSPPDWYKQADSRLPTIESVQTVARQAQQKGLPVVLDIEHWPLEGSPAVVQSSLQKYMTVLTWFQSAAPGLSVGYYGVPPLRDYWRSTKGLASQEYRSWMAKNDQLRPLADAVHVLYPSLYTFYPDRAGWRTYAIAQIAEARRYAGGKPVYVFLWPQYHDSNTTLAGAYLPPAYWLLELQTAKQYADGIVIWGGWQENWDENAEWWRVTKDFMTAAPKAQPTAPAAPLFRQEEG